jgi:hypothetical protein
VTGRLRRTRWRLNSTQSGEYVKRRVPLTAPITWPTSIGEIEREVDRQVTAPLKQEHQLAPSEESLTDECAWKGGGDSCGSAEKNVCGKQIQEEPTSL